MNTDNTILKLKEDIASKKLALKSSTRFVPLTNCSLLLDGQRHNIHVLKKDMLIHLLVKLDSYAESAIDLELYDQYVISGFSVEDWLVDLRSKLAISCRTEETNKLRVMENRLTELLSNEKRVELEVAEITKMLSA